MPLLDQFVSRKRVNILKQVKVRDRWKLVPAVIEANGKLKDRVRINGRVETHLEGIYFIEWRDADKRRRRTAVRNPAEVIEQARLKSLELEGVAVASLAANPLPQLGPTLLLPGGPSMDAQSSNLAAVTTAIFGGVEKYLQQFAAMVQNATANPPSASTPVASLPASPSLTETPAAAPALALPPPAIPVDTTQVAPAKNVPCALITDKITAFLKNVEPPNKAKKTYDEYRFVLHLFRDNCPRKDLFALERQDLLNFKHYLFSLGNEARTVFNRLGIVQQLLNENGIPPLLKKGDKPKWVRKLREMYQPDELEALFRACNPDEKIRYLYLLLTGKRNQEVRCTSWDDVDFKRQCVRVSAKKHLDFIPKDKEEREIPVPEQLLAALKEYRARQTGPNPHNLLFPTRNGNPDTKLEEKLKGIAYKAGLNCGRCHGKHKCSEGPYCSKWIIHKFRHTFATNSLESGASIRTLQDWLGHSDLESTMVYLKLVKRKDIKQLVDNSQLATLSAPFMTSKAPSKRK